jgi:hypothetical protein
MKTRKTRYYHPELRLLGLPEVLLEDMQNSIEKRMIPPVPPFAGGFI